MNKTDLNDLVTCKCGIVLQQSKIMNLVQNNDNTPDTFIYICPLCKREVKEWLIKIEI